MAEPEVEVVVELHSSMLMLIRRNFIWIITVGPPLKSCSRNWNRNRSLELEFGVRQMKGSRVLRRGTVADLNSC